MKGNLFIISSPSGGGKGTLIERVLESTAGISYSVSYSTRKRRPHEVDGVNYNFISKDTFQELIEEDEFLEYAEVHGNFYGTSRSYIEKETGKGNDVILEIDVQGAFIVKERMPEALGVFILPPSFEVLRERLISRSTEDEKDLAVRLRNSKDEVSQYKDFEFIVVNDDLDEAVDDLRSILVSSKLRTDRQMDYIRDILATFDG